MIGDRGVRIKRHQQPEAYQAMAECFLLLRHRKVVENLGTLLDLARDSEHGIKPQASECVKLVFVASVTD